MRLQRGRTFPISKSRHFRPELVGCRLHKCIQPAVVVLVYRITTNKTPDRENAPFCTGHCSDIVLLRVNCRTSSLTTLLLSRSWFCTHPSPVLILAVSVASRIEGIGLVTARGEVDDFARVISSDPAVQKLAASRRCLVRIRSGGR